MIFFYSKKATFLRIPKTGTTSIRKGIYEQIDDFVEVHKETPLDNTDYNITMVREPLDRFMSGYKMIKKNQPAITIKKLLDLIEDPAIHLDRCTPENYAKLHCAPFSMLVPDYSFIDEVFHYETFAPDFQRIASLLDVNIKKIPHIRHGGKAKPQIALEEKERFDKIFREDYRILDYELK